MNEIVITLNSGRKNIILLISVIFFLIGLWLFFYADELVNYWVISNPLIIKFCGLLCQGVFGFTILLSPKYLFRKIGLVIDDSGFENSSSVGGESGKVSWDEVSNICNGGTVILIYLIDPKRFISSKRSFFNKQSLKMNYRNYGTPIAINMFVLNSYVDTLERQLKQRWEEYKKIRDTIVES